jgi:hypothetical protein
MTSTTNRENDAALGYLLLRATIGTNIFIHGLSRTLAGPSHFADALVPTFQHIHLPASSVRLFVLREANHWGLELRRSATNQLRKFAASRMPRRGGGGGSTTRTGTSAAHGSLEASSQKAS